MNQLISSLARKLGLGALVLSFLVALAPPAAAQLVQSQYPVTNGIVNAVVEDNNYVYLGGSFFRVGTPTGSAAVTTTTGAIVEPFLQANDLVYAAIADGNGGWFIGGAFSSVRGLPRAGLAHILSDGSLDLNWAPSVTGGDVLALMLQGGHLYVGGRFTSVSGQTRNRVARVSASTGAVDSWSPNVNGPVSAFAFADNAVFLGGNFTLVEGQTRSRLAKVSTSGVLDANWIVSVTTGGASYVNTIVADASHLYLGGFFTHVTINGVTTPRSYLLKVSIGASSGPAVLDATWAPNPSYMVNSLVLEGSNLYVGGGFGSIGGLSRLYLARISATGTGDADASWFTKIGGTAANVNGGVASLALVGSQLYASGAFRYIGSNTEHPHIIRFNAANGVYDPTYNPNPSNQVRTVAVSGTQVMLGGDFTLIGPGQTTISNLCRLIKATGQLDAAWAPNPQGGISAMLIDGNQLYVGGNFTSIGSSPGRLTIHNVARLLTTSSTGQVDNTWQHAMPYSGNVNALARLGGTIYIGGTISISGYSNYLRKIDMSTAAVDATFNPGLTGGSIRSLCVIGNSVYAGGSFTVPVLGTRRVIKLNPSGVVDASWHPNPNASVYALATDGMQLYLGGELSQVGGVARARVARVAADGVGTLDATWVPPTLNTGWTTVNAIAPVGSSVYIGGEFITLGGTSRSRLVSLSATTGTPDAAFPDFGLRGVAGQHPVTSIAASATNVFVGGAFTGSVTERRANFIAIQLAPPPTLTGFSPASGPIGTLVTITGTNLADAINITVGGVPAIPISRSATQLVAMVMPGTPFGAGNAVQVITPSGPLTASSSYQVVASQAPNSQQGSKLVGTGTLANTYQGWGGSVSVSADGNTAIVGGYGDNSGFGAAWVYTRSGGVWTQQAKLVGTGSAGNALQGVSATLSADGNTAILGGETDNGAIGAAWVFTRSGGVWTQQGPKLVGTGAIGASRQGTSVALSGDGSIALVGGPEDNGETGAVWVFARNASGVWSQQGPKLVGTNIQGTALFGWSVALSADGNTAIAGAWRDNNFTGAAWVFSRVAGTWSQQGSKLVGTGAVGNGQQGIAVAISADGNTALVGGSGDSNGNPGAAWVFTRSVGAWAQQGSKLAGSGAVGSAGQGIAVSLSADGNTALLSGRGDNSNLGATWVFARTAGVWSQQGSKLVGTGSVGASPIQQGSSVALSADGNTALVGGPGDNSNVGAAWVFTYTPPPAISAISPASGPIGTLVTITGTNLTGATAITIGGVSAIPISNSGTSLVAMVMPGTPFGAGNAVQVTTPSGPLTASSTYQVVASKIPNTQQAAKLVGTGYDGDAFQGRSVAISADGNTAIVGGPLENSGEGAVWIYTRSGTSWSQQTALGLVGSGAVGPASQGSSVAISADGNTALVGGPVDNNGLGAVWVFVRSGSSWSQQGPKLVGTGYAGNSAQGHSVALSADGNTALVGGELDQNSLGACWVFTRSSNVWSQQGQKLVGTGSAFASNQGSSVALSADGNTALIGARGDNFAAGASWVFVRNSASWSQQGNKLIGTGSQGVAVQGSSVAINADGNTAIIGGWADNNSVGAVWIFQRASGSWVQQGAKLVGTGAQGNTNQGWSVSISADGNTVAFGGTGDNGGLGAAWFFTRTGTSWSQQALKRVGTGAEGAAGQGFGVAISANGNTALIGGPNDRSSAFGNASFRGAAWVFVNDSWQVGDGAPADEVVAAGPAEAELFTPTTEAEPTTLRLQIAGANPFDGSTELRVRGAQGLVELEVRDVSGRLVARYSGLSREAALRVGAEWASGFYVVRASDGATAVTTRLIKR